MKNKVKQFIKKHELDAFIPLLLVLLIVGVPGVLLARYSLELRSKANKNPKEYLVSIYIENDRPTTSISVIDKEGRDFSYTNKKEGKIADRIQSIVENNLPLLKQKQIPNSLPESISELRDKPLRVEVSWKNSETQKESRIVSNGKVFIKKSMPQKCLLIRVNFQ